MYSIFLEESILKKKQAVNITKAAKEEREEFLEQMNEECYNIRIGRYISWEKVLLNQCNTKEKRGR